MNFLAHLHLASLAESSLLGNLVADFTRGNPDNHWPKSIAEGIRLHRRLDQCCDALPEVRQARNLFHPERRRVASIALDVIWDHFLARYWAEFGLPSSLAQFCLQVEQHLSVDLALTSEQFQQVNHKIWSEHWLENYADKTNITWVLQQMARRRPRLSLLAACDHDFFHNYQSLEQLFRQFYPQLMLKAAEKSL